MPITFQHKPGLIAYITCGDPDLETSREVAMAAIAAGADVLELGVPFSDPVADGPVIQAASDRALKNGVRLGDVLKLAADIRKHAPEAGLIVFSYFNPILRYGLERFRDDAASAGVDGALVTDLPVEEADEYIQLMRDRDLATVFLAAPTSTDERLKSVCEASTGFVYAVSRTGVTGVRQQLATDAGALVRRLRQFTSLPIAVGFGVSNPQQFAEVGAFADAAVVGTAIVQLIERSGRGSKAANAVAEFVGGLRAGNSAVVKA
jgi:tryptophan synthase alpha chain